MHDKLESILDAADWKELTPMLIAFAHAQICRAFWRGLPVRVSDKGLPCLDGMSAEDFVNDALNRILEGVRSYNFTASLEQNLKGVIRSQVWSWNKSANRQPLASSPMTEVAEDFTLDLIETAPDQGPNPMETLAQDEERSFQQNLLAEFRQFLSADPDLTQVLHAFEAGVFTPREIEDLTGIPAARVSELKRKLSTKMTKFISLRANDSAATRTP